MNTLQISMQHALELKGEDKTANDKAYLEFIKANFIIPIEKNNNDNSEPKVLFLEENQELFLPVFNEIELFDTWAKDIKDNIDLLKLSGVDLLKSVGDNVIVCLNIGCETYKAFYPQEIARMKNIVMKIFKN